MRTLPPKAITRESNIEVLRIIATFLVLVVHADFFSLGIPTQNECINSPISSITRYFFQSLSICCVDTFILISGWFGINPKLKSFASFIFQCLFFLCGIYAILLLTGDAELSHTGIKGLFALTDLNWFIKAYIVLYILSPILNTYIEKVGEKELRNTIIYFFIFQTIYGCLYATYFFSGGYSPLSFIGLYLLARYTKIYKENFLTRNIYLYTFFAITIFQAIIAFLQKRIGFAFENSLLTSYINPLIIIQSLALLLYFSKVKLKNQIVNWVAASSFAVFLIHTNPNIIFKYFKATIIDIYNNTNGVECLLHILAYLCIVFVIGIIVDKPRIFIWRKLWNLYEKRK